VKLPARVIKRAETQDLTRNIQWGSPQAFYQQLSECPNGLYIWGNSLRR